MDKKTPLYPLHLKAGAKMVEFCTWQMPLHYGSQIEEHRAVRQSAGIFDVSHMTIVDVLGPAARDYLRYLLSNDIDKLNKRGKALYTCMLNNDGHILDDLIVYFADVEHYRLVLNAATRDKDLKWMNKIASDFSVGLHERADLAMLAIQGPLVKKKVHAFLSPRQLDAALMLRHFEFVEIDGLFIAATGYTGEEGFEIIASSHAATTLWQKALAGGIRPCGLGARDTLRLEAGLNLYGTDMDLSTTPFDCGLGWTVAWEPKDRLFIGRTALELQKEKGLKQKFVGIVLEEKGVLRKGQKVFSAEGLEGIITSGTFSPTLNVGIGMARVPVAFGEHCFVEVRDKKLKARVIRLPFVKKGKRNFDA